MEKAAVPLSELQRRLHWILRVTAALCFIGHGAWGVITKAGWLPFFASMGIPEEWAWRIMPLVGCWDIGLGLLLLWKPRRAILLWMFGWCVWTALLRPIAGFGMWEVWERAGNYGPPFALLVLGGAVGVTWREWLGEMREPELTPERLDIVELVLRLSLALLLLGHGGFGVFVQKPMLIAHWQSLGVPADVPFLIAVGAFEFLLAAAVLLARSPGLLVVVLVWKLGSELLYPLAGTAADVFEFVERWGDYGTPLALITIYRWQKRGGQELAREHRSGRVYQQAREGDVA